MLESECSEDFLEQLGLKPSASGTHPPTSNSQRGSGDSRAPPRSGTAATSDGAEVLPSARPESAEPPPSVMESDRTDAGQGGTTDGSVLSGGGEVDTVDPSRKGVATDDEHQALQTTNQSPDEAPPESAIPQTSERGDKAVTGVADQGPPSERAADNVTAEAPAEEIDAAPDTEGTERPLDPEVASPGDSTNATGAHNAGGAADGSATTETTPPETREGPPDVPQEAPVSPDAGHAVAYDAAAGVPEAPAAGGGPAEGGTETAGGGDTTGPDTGLDAPPTAE